MQSRVRLQQAQTRDERFLQSLWAQTFGTQFSVLPEPLATQLCQQQYQLQLRSYREKHPVLDIQLIRFDDDDAGRVITCELPDELHVLDLAVLPELQGRGIGTTVLRQLQQRAGDRPVRLEVETQRPRAQALYERLGFVQTGRTATHVFMVWRA